MDSLLVVYLPRVIVDIVREYDEIKEWNPLLKCTHEFHTCTNSHDRVQWAANLKRKIHEILDEQNERVFWVAFPWGKWRGAVVIGWIRSEDTEKREQWIRSNIVYVDANPFCGDREVQSDQCSLSEFDLRCGPPNFHADNLDVILLPRLATLDQLMKKDWTAFHEVDPQWLAECFLHVL